MSKFVLYNYFRSSTSYRVRIALHYKNIPFEYYAINLLKNEQNSDGYKKINPQGEVPSLIHNKKILSQSLPIIEYIDEIFPNPPLLPKDPYLRARIRQVCENINAFIHPICNLQILKYLENKHHYTQNDKELWIHHWASKGLSATEKILFEHAKTYCFGDQLTMADLFITPMVFSAQRFNVDMNPYPTIMKTHDECLKLDCFKNAHPYRQIDTPEELRL